MTAAESHDLSAQGRAQTQSQTRAGQDRRLKRLVARGVAACALMAVVGTAALLALGDGETAPAQAPEQPARQVNVVVAKARMMTFRRSLTVQGNVQARRLAMVSPRVAGVLEALFVDEGDEVEAGKTRLFQTDSVKLGEAVEMSKHGVAVAESSLRVKRASLERAQAEYDKSEFDRRRYQTLRERDVVAETEMQEVKLSYRQAAATLKQAEAQVALDEAELQRARSSLAIAQKDLADSLVKAPISGRIAERYQEPGEMGNPGQPVLRIEDTSLVEVSAFLPAVAYGQIEPDRTMMHVAVNGVAVGEHPVSYKSPTIDAALRTFEVQCLIQDPPSAVAPGAMADVQIVLERRQGLGVARDAIQERSGRTVVFAISDARARMIPVEVGLETEGFVEIRSGDLKEGTDVAVMGGVFLEADSPVRVLRGD